MKKNLEKRERRERETPEVEMRKKVSKERTEVDNRHGIKISLKYSMNTNCLCELGRSQGLPSSPHFLPPLPPPFGLLPYCPDILILKTLLFFFFLSPKNAFFLSSSNSNFGFTAFEKLAGSQLISSRKNPLKARQCKIFILFFARITFPGIVLRCASRRTDLQTRLFHVSAIFSFPKF